MCVLGSPPVAPRRAEPTFRSIQALEAIAPLTGMAPKASRPSRANGRAPAPAAAPTAAPAADADRAAQKRAAEAWKAFCKKKRCSFCLVAGCRGVPERQRLGGSGGSGSPICTSAVGVGGRSTRPASGSLIALSRCRSAHPPALFDPTLPPSTAAMQARRTKSCGSRARRRRAAPPHASGTPRRCCSWCVPVRACGWDQRHGGGVPGRLPLSALVLFTQHWPARAAQAYEAAMAHGRAAPTDGEGRQGHAAAEVGGWAGREPGGQRQLQASLL